MVVQTKSCPASENIDAEENSENSKSVSLVFQFSVFLANKK